MIGAHLSIAGGLSNALIRGKEIDATTIQIFTKNQRTWATKEISTKEITDWERDKTLTEIGLITSHGSYLINIGSTKKELLQKSINALSEEFKRCHALKIDYLNIHPGAYTDGLPKDCLDTIVNSIITLEPTISQGNTKLLLETTAGQGTNVGSTFEEIAYILNRVKSYVPIGVCIDTCHIFAAGYNIKTKQGWDQVLEKFDSTIGLNRLHCLHLNDSKHPLGSRKDRHEQLGKGHIGIDAFAYTMQNKILSSLPKYLETPDPNQWNQEILMLKKFAF